MKCFQLSAIIEIIWSGHGDLNTGPHAPKARALARLSYTPVNLVFGLSVEMDPLARKVALRFRDQRGPSKKTRVRDLAHHIHETTGVSGGVSVQIADAFVRGRDVERLAIGKRWPIQNGVIEGPDGNLALNALQ